MNNKIFRTGIALISYVVALSLIVVYFKEIIAGLDTFLQHCSPFIIGIIMALFLNPLYVLFMKLFNKLKLPEWLARFISTIFVLAIASAIVSGIILVVIPQVVSNFKSFFNNFDRYLMGLQNTINEVTKLLNIENYDMNLLVKFLEELGNKVQSSITEWGPQAINYTRRIISSVTNVLIGIIFSIYIVNAKDRLFKQINRLTFALCSEKVYKVLHHIGSVVTKTFDNYVVGQVIEAIILGSLCYLGMLAFNFSYPGLISVVVAVTALVPIVGTVIGGAIGFFLYLLVDPVKALIFLVFFTVLQQLENNLIYPRVVGKQIGLPGLWVLFAVMLGSKMGGFIGMLCGVPIFTIIYNLVKDLTIFKEKEKFIMLINEGKLNPDEEYEEDELTGNNPVEAPENADSRNPENEDARESEINVAADDAAEARTSFDAEEEIQEEKAEDGFASVEQADIETAKDKETSEDKENADDAFGRAEYAVPEATEVISEPADTAEAVEEVKEELSAEASEILSDTENTSRADEDKHIKDARRAAKGSAPAPAFRVEGGSEDDVSNVRYRYPRELNYQSIQRTVAEHRNTVLKRPILDLHELEANRSQIKRTAADARVGADKGKTAAKERGLFFGRNKRKPRI